MLGDWGALASITSSAAFERERYAVQAIPTVETKGYMKYQYRMTTGILIESYQLELDWHNTEVDDLNQRPYHKICFQRRQIHVS
jgi:hypothetical protein